MRSSSQDGQSNVPKWLTGGLERGKFGNDSRSAASVALEDNQDKTDDEYEEAREETEHNSPKEPTAKDRDRCDQKTDLHKASPPKIYDMDQKPQPAIIDSRRDKDGRDDRTEDGLAPNVLVTINIIAKPGSKEREEHARADRILVSVPGHTGEGRRDEHSQAGQIVSSSRGPKPPRESPSTGHRGGDRKDEQRQSDQNSSKPGNMPGKAAPPVVAPAPPYKGKKEEERRPPSCCVVL